MSEEEPREVRVEKLSEDGALISNLAPGHERYRNVENLFALVGKRPDGGEAILFMPSMMVSDSLTEQLKAMAAHVADYHSIETKLVRFVRAEVVEVFEP